MECVTNAEGVDDVCAGVDVCDETEPDAEDDGREFVFVASDEELAIPEDVDDWPLVPLVLSEDSLSEGKPVDDDAP